MRKLFNMDSPFFQLLYKMADLMILNVLAIFCSIPIFTIGAAQTALCDVTGRFLRQEGQPWKDYWRAFRSNFKQATAIWLILMAAIGLCLCALRYYASIQTLLGTIALVLVCITLFLCMGAMAWAFPLLSRFENPVKHTLRNAFYCTVLHLPQTLAVVALNILPIVLCFLALEWFVRLGVIWMFLWFALAAYWNMYLLRKPFAALEGTADKDKEEVLENE